MQSLFAALAAAALSSPPTDLPPLQGDWIEVLYGPKGERVGSLVVPLGARDPRPLVVAVHGASGHSTWMCGATHDIVGPHPFVVCPHPDAALEAMESWTDVTQLRRAVDRAVTAATNKYASYIQKEDALYIGHSQGAMWASAMLALPGSMKFPNVIFYEGIPSNLGAASHQLANAGCDAFSLSVDKAGGPKVTGSSRRCLDTGGSPPTTYMWNRDTSSMAPRSPSCGEIFGGSLVRARHGKAMRRR